MNGYDTGRATKTQDGLEGPCAWTFSVGPWITGEETVRDLPKSLNFYPINNSLCKMSSKKGCKRRKLCEKKATTSQAAEARGHKAHTFNYNLLAGNNSVKGF